MTPKNEMLLNEHHARDLDLLQLWGTPLEGAEVCEALSSGVLLGWRGHNVLDACGPWPSRSWIILFSFETDEFSTNL